jgi:hypothetical protein
VEVKFMKIKTKQPNVLRYGQKEGVELEVSEETGKHLVARGVAEEVKKKKAPKDTKKEAPKKEDDK